MRITLPSGTEAELAVPDAPERGVVLAPDLLGLRPLFDELCDRLATEHRWAVCAPEPFPSYPDKNIEERLARVKTLVDAGAVGDLLAAAGELRRRAEVERVAVLGFCLGGMYALKAGVSGAFDRVVSFYGMIRVPDSYWGPGHRHPIDLLASAPHSPVLAILAGRDGYTPAADIADLAAIGAETVVYPDAQHAFVHDAALPAHRSEDAADVWRRVVAFLAVAGEST